jgi:predicted SprT family Zn-dependent metalloprotease
MASESYPSVDDAPEDWEECWNKDCDVVICNGPIPVSNPRKKVDPDMVEEARTLVLTTSRRLYGRKKKLALLETLPVSYNGRLSRAIGLCKVRSDRRVSRFEQMMAGGGGKPIPVSPFAIEISSKYKLTEALLLETLIHEFCHAARAAVSKNYIEEWDHGDDWRKLMVACGQLPSDTCSAPEIMEQAREHIRAKREKKRQRSEAALKGKKKARKSSLRVGQTVYFEYKGVQGKGKITKLNPTGAARRFQVKAASGAYLTRTYISDGQETNKAQHQRNSRVSCTAAGIRGSQWEFDVPGG